MTFDANTILHIVSILFGAGGIASFILNVRRAKSQNNLDLSTAWKMFSEPLLARIDHLEGLVNRVEKENIYLRRYVERLIRQIIRLGGIPEPYFAEDNHADDEKDREPKIP